MSKSDGYLSIPHQQWITWREEGKSWQDIIKLSGCKHNDAHRTVRRAYAAACKALNVAPATKGLSEPVTPPQYREAAPKHRFIVVSVLNNCRPHPGFLRCLLNMKAALDADLVAVPMLYRNVSLMTAGESYYWPSELDSYYIEQDLPINKNLIVGGSIKVQATASRPTSSLLTYGRGASLIIGHPRVEMQVTPAPAVEMPRIVLTTGSISEPKYTDTKAGKLGEFHHQLSALLVEVDGKFFRTRHLHYDEKLDCIYHINKKYNGDGTIEDSRAEAVILGDLHAPYTPEEVLRRTFYDPDSYLNVLNPKHVVFHDAYDALPISHHHDGKPLTQARLARQGLLNLHRDLVNWGQIMRNIKRTAPPDAKLHIVESNHDNHLDKWLDSTRPMKDPHNFEMYSLLLNDVLIKNRSALECWASRWGIGENYNFVRANDLLDIAGIDCSQHGHAGPNGVKGSAQAFAKSTRKMVVGHTHTPFIYGPVYGVGVLGPLDPDYRQGHTSWLRTNCTIHPNGKRVLDTLVNGSYF